MCDISICFTTWSQAFLSSSCYGQLHGASKEQGFCEAEQGLVGTYKAISLEAVCSLDRSLEHLFLPTLQIADPASFRGH